MTYIGTLSFGARVSLASPNAAARVSRRAPSPGTERVVRRSRLQVVVRELRLLKRVSTGSGVERLGDPTTRQDAPLLRAPV